MSFVDIETRVLSMQTLMQVTAESSSSDELNQLGAGWLLPRNTR
jgi:hypothetical protein